MAWKSLHDRQVDKLVAVRRAYGSGQATAKQVGSVLKECTASEIEEAEDRAGSMDGILAKLGRWF